jgi:23S rRNA (cytosine1962-C5)-methyltransferase
MNYKKVFLRKSEERRLRAGHLWVYSNEIETKISPLKHFTAGELVTLCSSSGRPLGTGYINPNVLLCARLLTEQPDAAIDVAFFKHRIQQALALRLSFFDKPYYRLVYGESDGLPGVVIDRFGDTLVVQISTAGMEALRSHLIDALKAVIQPAHILLRADSSFRELEGLEKYTEIVHGAPPTLVSLEENGVKFTAPIFEGQKTGWFYDHRMNRANLRHIVMGKRVLDIFSYIGGWGIQAACFGAREVTCIDSSAKALEWVQQHSVLNQVEDKIQTIEQDAFDALNQLIQAGEKFDVVILDPPAFIKRRKDTEAGKQAYYRANALAMQLLSSGGILISASCSMHLAYSELIDIIRTTARQQQRTAHIVMQGHQSPDHPIHPAIVETDYLKSVMVFVS